MNYEAEPLVSVGITTYNRPEYLRQAIESVVNQTYRNLEIIISEDCTPCEKTKELIRDYAKRDPRIKCFNQKTTLGPPNNIRFVLQQATGEYFMWADDDDVRDQRWVEALLTKIAVPGTSVAVGKVVSIDAGGRAVAQYGALQYAGLRPLRIAKYFLAEERDGKSNVVCGLFRTDFLRSLKHWSQYQYNRFGGGDYLFVLDCVQHGNVLVEPSVCIYKRLPVYDEEFLRNGPSRFQRALRQLEYFAASLAVLHNWFDKMIVALLIPVRLARTAIFEARLLLNEALGKVRRALHFT